MAINVGTIFSGIGAPEQALLQLNISHNIVFACDNGERKLKTSVSDVENMINKCSTNLEKNSIITTLYKNECSENFVETTYKANYKVDENSYYQDVRFLDGTEYTNKIDLLVGGSPCQSFSIMGKRKGLEEARGTLFYEYARIVSEVKPKVFIYENVTGMLNHDNGNTWKIISSIFDELGYVWKYYILNSKDFGIPQNRRRIFFFFFKKKYKELFKNLEDPKTIKLETTLEDYLDEEIPNKYYLPEKGFNRVTNPCEIKHVSLNGKIARCQVACQQYNWFGDMRFETSIPKRVLDDERIYKGYYNGEYGVARCLTPRECLRLMGFSESFKIKVPDMQMYRQVGNSISVNVLKEILKCIFKTEIFGSVEI